MDATTRAGHGEVTRSTRRAAWEHDAKKSSPPPPPRTAPTRRASPWVTTCCSRWSSVRRCDADYDGGIDTFFLDDADDVLFGQLAAEHEPPAAKGARAAAKAAVESLPTVVVDAARGDTQCAVCKDGMEAGERARRLPCAHLYHDGCILPWLAIRNTCPLCRHELPTDDPEYEKRRVKRRSSGDSVAQLGTPMQI